jgi:hypothetical protein
MDQSVCVPYACFHDAMEVEETTVLDPGHVEDKYYVPGIGLVRSVFPQGDVEDSSLVARSRPGGGGSGAP